MGISWGYSRYLGWLVEMMFAYFFGCLKTINQETEMPPKFNMEPRKWPWAIGKSSSNRYFGVHFEFWVCRWKEIPAHFFLQWISKIRTNSRISCPLQASVLVLDVFHDFCKKGLLWSSWTGKTGPEHISAEASALWLFLLRELFHF